MEQKDDPIGKMLSLETIEPRPLKPRKWLVFNRSPLARKIILFNLIALGILVSGVLYLNQAQETQVQFRSASLAQEVEIMAAAIRSHQDNPAYDNIRGQAFQNLFNEMAAKSGSIVQVYGVNAEIQLMYVPEGLSAAVSDGDAVISALQKLWDSIASPLAFSSPEAAERNLRTQFKILAEDAMQTGERSKAKYLAVGGEIYIAVATPIITDSGLLGAILISTRPGEIDSIIRAARQQILQVFLLATLSSIVLSMVLANSIARPLRRLSAAAQHARDEAGGQLNMARVNIPDLSARPDEIGDLSRSMRKMTDALLERIDANQSFAADVSHEIKNPLTSLRSAVETLGYVEDENSRAALLAVIQSDVDRLDRLVTDISNASRLEADLVRDKWEDVDICRLLNSIIENFKLTDRSGTADISLSIEVENRYVPGIESRLEQVFTNLVSNALSFVPEDGWVRVKVRSISESCLEVEVTDNGPGIPEDNLQDVFSRFYSERPVEQFGQHSGLGLAISRQIIEAHGGSIIAGNRKEGGAIFVVTLPR